MYFYHIDEKIFFFTGTSIVTFLGPTAILCLDGSFCQPVDFYCKFRKDQLKVFECEKQVFILVTFDEMSFFAGTSIVTFLRSNCYIVSGWLIFSTRGFLPEVSEGPTRGFWVMKTIIIEYLNVYSAI